MMSIDDIRTRLLALERRVDKLYWGFAGGAAVAMAMSGGYIWYGSKTLEKVDKSADSLAQIQTDITVMKAEQARAAKDGDRAWTLVRSLMKSGAKVEEQ
jgi:hypothetical protein